MLVVDAASSERSNCQEIFCFVCRNLWSGAERTLSIPVFVSQSQQTDPGVTALVMLLRFHGVGADPAQILHRFGPRIGVPEMLRCAKELGLRARVVKSQPQRLAGTALPAHAGMRGG